MRIKEIAVDGFGLLHGTRIQPHPGLTLVRGQNEAGKTTLLAFVRAILFGFETHRYRALAGGRRGGWLDIEMADQRRFRIERYGLTGGAGRLRVLGTAGVDLGPGQLPQLLQGVEQRVFRNIFAFGLDELAQFERLTDSEVAARIYGAGLGLGAVSALEVESALRGASEGLFKPGGHNPVINALLRDIEQVDGRLRSRDLPREYSESHARLKELDERLAELASELRGIGDQRRTCERLVDGWPTWIDLQAALGQRAELGEVPSYPADTLERHGSLETDCRNAATSLERAIERRERCEVDSTALVVDETIVARRSEVEAILQEASIDRTRRKELERVAHERELAQAQFDESLQRLGAGWAPERVAEFDDSIAVQTEISGRFRTLLDRSAENLATVHRDVATTGTGLADARAELESIDGELAEVVESLAGRPQPEVRERQLRTIDELRARLEITRKAGQVNASQVDAGASSVPEGAEPLDERLRHARALRGALERERDLAALLAALPALAAGAAGPGGRYLAPTVFAAGSVVAAGVSLVVGAPALVAVLIALLGLAVATYLLLQPGTAIETVAATRANLDQQLADVRGTAAVHRAALKLEAGITLENVEAVLGVLDQEGLAAGGKAVLLEQADRAAHEATQVEVLLTEACVEAGLPQVPTDADVGTFLTTLVADRELDARRVGLVQQRTILARRCESLERRCQDLAATLETSELNASAAQTEWSAWLEAHGLDPTLDRETAARVVETVTAAKRPLQMLRSLEERLAHLQDEHLAFVTSLSQLAGLLPGGRLDVSRLPESVAELDRRLIAALEQERIRAGIAEELEGLRRDEEEALGADQRARAAYGAFLEEHGVPDAATLRTEVERAGRVQLLEGKIATDTQALAALSGPGPALAALQEALDAIDDIEATRRRIDELVAATGDHETERSGVHEEAGGLRDRLVEMERDVAATAERQRRSDLQARLADQAESWTVLALATAVLARTRHAYEAAHRPAVVESAERYFREWTDGRYLRILAPLGHQVEAVEHRDGTQVLLAGLSRGTAEQLYLALRFGLVEHFAAGAEPLPIVMDDILVNFDDERAARAARSIEELAKHQQVMYFTCHPETPVEPDAEIVLPRLVGVTEARTVGTA